MAQSESNIEIDARPERGTPRLWMGIHLDGRAVVLAGLGAGLIFMVLELLTAALFRTGTPFGPAYVTLRGFIGAETLPGQHDPALVLAGIFMHFVLSVLVVLPLAVFIHPWKRYLATAVGFIYGYALYFINFVLFAMAIPLLTTARDVVMLVDYALFGMAAAWLYVTFKNRAASHQP